MVFITADGKVVFIVKEDRFHLLYLSGAGRHPKGSDCEEGDSPASVVPLPSKDTWPLSWILSPSSATVRIKVIGYLYFLELFLDDSCRNSLELAGTQNFRTR